MAIDDKVPPRTQHRRAWLILCWLLIAHANAATPLLHYEVIARYKHPENIFTQGLELSGDTVYESSGLYGRSYIVAWTLQTQAIAVKQNLSAEVFAEGLTLWNDRIYALSWREGRGFILDRTTLKTLSDFSYEGEGWGLTHNDKSLIMSDGTDALRFINPDKLVAERSINIREGATPVANLNELEWIPARAGQRPRLLANIWQSDEIVVIDIEKAQVTARLDLRKLYPKSTRSGKADVLNGIAFDPRDETLLVTGKFWPYVYKIRVLDALP